MLYEGAVLGNTYQIVSMVGSGGTGDVYLAYHLRLEKYVVVKKIKDNFIGQVNVRAEVDILKKLKHTYLPQVYDFVQMGNTVYTVMDYIEGSDLEQYIKAGYFIEESTLLKWLRQLCEVLEYLHSQNPPIIHSDIKPGNIMITKEGNVCLIDFNISLDGDDSSQISGISLPYASPEQYEKAMLFLSHMNHTGIVLDGRSDMYSMAVSFYYLMTGSPPANPNEAAIPLSEFNLPYSEGLIYTIEKAMEYDINYRYADMRQMLKAVNSVYKHTIAYRLYLLGIVISSITYVAVMGIGIWCIVHGHMLKTDEQYDRINNEFVEYYQEGSYDAAIDTGVNILNDSHYTERLRKNKKDRIEILHILGECYFENEDYVSALGYYEEAAKLITDIGSYSDYYRDYIVTLVRCGYISEAETELAKVSESGISNIDIRLVDVEVLIYNRQYEVAINKIDGLINENISDTVRMHLLIIGSDAAKEIRNYTKQIEYLEEAENISSTMSILRKLGNAYMLIVNQVKLRENEQKEYMKKALECYSELSEKNYSSLNDKLNLAICYRALEQYDKSIKLLKELEKEYTDYKIYMNLAFAYDRAGDLSRAETYTNKALSQYDKTPANDRESEGSDNIQSLKELEKKYD